MPKKWVVNASPIISLTKINKASFLIELCDELLIPKGVAEEIDRGAEDDPARVWLQQFAGAYIKDVGSIDAVISAWDLGRGETEVINWAFTNPGWTPVLDDRAARNCVHSLNRRVFGTIGILILAKKQQKIEAINPLLIHWIKLDLELAGICLIQPQIWQVRKEYRRILQNTILSRFQL